MPFYICTVRRARLNGKSQYVELIPKLFSDVWLNENELPKIISSLDLRQSKNIIFNQLLNNKSNLIYKSEYILPDDIDKIIKLNLDNFNNNHFTHKKFLSFIEHLYRAHDNMEYGLYFSIKWAENDLDFLSKINRAKLRENQKILYYSKLEKILEYVDKKKKKLNIISSLCYYNIGWSYGKMDDNSSKYLGNKQDFYQSIIDNIQKGFDLNNYELVIQIPLPVELFKFTFERYGGRTNLLKYKKKKYINL